MPMPAIQRAEKLLLKISADIRTMQMQTYELQDKLAQKIHQKYCRLTDIVKENPTLQESSLVYKALSFVVTNDETRRKLFQEGADTFIGVQRTHRMDAPKTQTEGKLGSLQSQQGQLASLNDGFRSIMQTHDTALQRLQQIEGSAKN
jgi:hypothetical protein